MAEQTLKVKITADVKQAQSQIKQFKSELKGLSAESVNTVASFSKVTVAIGALVVALKGLKALVRNAVNVAATGDAIKDNAQKIYMTTTAYQEWGYVMEQNGLEINQLKTGMRQLSQHVAAGDDVLKKYGITATDVNGAFEQAVYNIQNMETETQKITAATELFGSRASELMPIFNMTNMETQELMATYRALGGTMSNELIAASDLCSDSITQMRAAWGGLRNLLATYLIPVVTKVVQWLTLLIAKVRIVLSALFGVKETFGGGGKTSLPKTSGAVATNTGNTAKNLKNAAKHAKELRRTLMGIDELTRLVEKATAAAGSGGGGGGIGSGIDVDGIEAVADILSNSELLTKIDEFRQKIEALKERVEGLKMIFSGLKDIVTGDYESGIKKLKDGIELAFPGIKKLADKWDEFKKSFDGKVATAKAVLVDGFTNIWTKVQATWKKVYTTIGGKVATARAVLKDEFSSIWNRIKNAWNGIKGRKVELTLQLTDKLKSIWNKLADKVNAARDKSAFARTMLPHMPKLARGGILTMPTAAIMGEYAGARQNPEIATPQSLMYETMQRANGDLVGALAQMTRQLIEAIEDKDLSVSIGDEQVARSAQRGNTAYYNRTGKALLGV